MHSFNSFFSYIASIINFFQLWIKHPIRANIWLFCSYQTIFRPFLKVIFVSVYVLCASTQDDNLQSVYHAKNAWACLAHHDVWCTREEPALWPLHAWVLFAHGTSLKEPVEYLYKTFYLLNKARTVKLKTTWKVILNTYSTVEKVLGICKEML